MFFLKHFTALVSVLSLALSLCLLSLFSPIIVANDQAITTPIDLDPLLIIGTPSALDFPLNAPRNVSEFNSNTINELGFNSSRDSVAYVPNFNLLDAGSQGFGDRSNIRGLANTPLYTTPGIVLYIDDVPYLSSFTSFNQLINVESIEVYRGPQGGLFGKNSYAGVINVRSRRPTNKLFANLSVDKGNFDAFNVNSQVSGALIKDRLFASLGVVYSEREAILKIIFLIKMPTFKNT